MTKQDQTWILTCVLFVGAIFLYLMSKEFPASALTYLLLGAVRFVLYVTGGIILLGFVQYQNQALRITGLIITTLVFLLNVLLYVGQLN